jgi:glycosyltransferase involved in cell wall biosynthesis
MNAHGHPNSAPRVALACPGVGRVQRGFERLFGDLHGVIRNHCDATLFKGGGDESADEKVLRFLPRGGKVLARVPLHRLIGRTPFHVECLSFALALLPHLRSGAFDVVHTIDPPLTRLLYKLREALRLDFRLLYTEGCAMPPADYPPADHIHQISQATLEEAALAGVSRDRMTLIPCGVHPDRFAARASKEQVRARLGIAQDRFVILSVAALNRNHKRTDFLIEEVAALPERALLWLDGSLDHGDPDLVEFARARLGERCLITHVSSDQVGELFKAADVMAHAALFEAFGIAIAEAAISGVPLLVHDSPHFRWLIPNDRCRIDMSESGNLASRLAEIIEDPAQLRSMCDPEDAASRFSWDALGERYAAVYSKVARAAATESAA